VADEVFHIKLGDTEPPLETTLWRGTSSTPASLVGATQVKLIITTRPGVTPDQYIGTVVSASGGTVRYEWVGNEFLTAGTYIAEWQVTYNDGSIATFPNDKEFHIIVRADLN
jgi:hypothetical protein